MANELSISAREAGAGIRAAQVTAGAAPRLPHAATAVRDGALSTESARVITKTVDMLPADATPDDIAHFDADLTACGIGSRPEVTGDGNPAPAAADTDRRTVSQRNHDALKALSQ